MINKQICFSSTPLLLKKLEWLMENLHEKQSSIIRLAIDSYYRQEKGDDRV